MNRKTTALILALALTLSLLFAVPVSAEEALTELLNAPFSDEAAQGALFAPADADTKAISLEWAEGIGHEDDAALKVTHTEGATYNSAANATRLTFAQPLPAGGVYHVSAWFYVPAAENTEGKGTLTGPGIVLNGDYPGAQGTSKFPVDFGTIPVDTWKEVNVTLPIQDKALQTLDFRFVINDQDKHPDLWYIDNIVISRVGDLVEVEVPTWDLTLPSIKDTLKDFFPVGNILEPNQLMDEEMMAMYKYHYNYVTLENSMKPIGTAPNKGEYVYGGADSVIEWAQANDIQVHGHTLVWHSQSAPWLTTGSDGNPLTRAEAKANLETYIKEVAGHFKGKLASWDVVNEAMVPSPSSGDWKASLRKGGSGNEASQFYAAYENGADKSKGESGADYIYDAFVFARQADPNAILFYLDFNETESAKREAMAKLAEDLNALWKDDARNTEPDRPLVEGLGLQAHYWTDDLNPSNVDATIARFISAGCKVAIAELDLPAGNYGSLDSRSPELTKSEADRQASLYGMLFEVFKKYKDNLTRVTFWGKADSQSWRAKGSPLLFDAQYKAKNTFYAALGLEQPVGETPSPEPSPTVEATEAPSPTVEATEETPATSEPPADKEGGNSTLIIILCIVGALIIAVVVAVVLGRKTKK